MPRVDREFVHNFQFFVEKRERIVNGKIRARNTSSEEKALHDDDWNEPDPHAMSAKAIGAISAGVLPSMSFPTVSFTI